MASKHQKNKAGFKAKKSSSELKEVRVATTVQSSNAEVAKAVEKIELQERNQVSQMAQFSPNHRDRRHQGEGRRGRFAEKTPPGTRTKMLKIIYERRAEYVQKKRYRNVILLVCAVVLSISAWAAMKNAYHSISSGASSLIHSESIEGWWKTVSQKVEPKTLAKKTKKIKNLSPVEPKKTDNKRIKSKKPSNLPKKKLKSAPRKHRPTGV